MLALAEMPINPRKPPTPRAVDIVAFPGVHLLDIAGPLQVFASANEWAAANGQSVPYAVAVVAAAPQVLSSAGLPILARPLPRAASAVDTLIAGGGGGVHAAAQDTALVRWFAARARKARRVASVCTGAFLLGAAGLLDDRRVATHWADCARLAAQFPQARVEAEPIFIRDGKISTSAGVTAGIDLALDLVQEDLGHAAAIAIARDLVVYLKRPGDQAQFSTVLELQRGGAQWDRLHAWIAGHLAHDLSAPQLAARAGMSERSFARHYRATFGMTPARAIEKMRVEAVQRLLESTDLPIKRIAARCGFGAEETMRRSFQRQLGATPQDYRHRFSARP